ncbi:MULTISPECIES: hypothetical protein [Bacteroides]|jgi:hypothetical protein|uniref:hypothetical protein n=1 Tax=Bacteroides TaxID=816 RepID=UPI0004DA82E7|nr:hypothetical protein [Bacteroides fragilis]MBY2902230.1 hypothetical protein [Bacteroides fragilis]MCE8576339.1 hypothetical protein [Bacteroides fragilis]MCE8610967.1 hypothetical protein [Bacteroides fragilis]MCM0237130.1 hypothetical protein [Bacteroides fragilis]MCM0274318.1 hypothetical protein [Bacteroides fragilis]
MNELDFNLRFLDLLNKGENIPAWGIPSVPQPIIVDENKYKLINCGVEYAPQRLYGVYWRQSNISYYRIAKGADAISFQFTGCYLAKVMYNSDYFVFHIHSSDSDSTAHYWNQFIDDNRDRIAEITIFKPAVANEKDDVMFKCLNEFDEGVFTIAGMITADNECYEILLNNKTCKAEVVLLKTKLTDPHLR